MTGCLDLLCSNTGGSRSGEEAHRPSKISSESATADADRGCTMGPSAHGAGAWASIRAFWRARAALGPAPKTPRQQVCGGPGFASLTSPQNILLLLLLYLD